jgi:hypothetical protein
VPNNPIWNGVIANQATGFVKSPTEVEERSEGGGHGEEGGREAEEGARQGGKEECRQE